MQFSGASSTNFDRPSEQNRKGMKCGQTINGPGFNFLALIHLGISAVHLMLELG